MLRLKSAVFLMTAVIVIILSGCAAPGYSPVDKVSYSEDNDKARCIAVWDQFQSRVNEAEVFDAQEWPLPEYPYLRLTRSASYVSKLPLSYEQQSLWLTQAYQRGKHARRIENEKLNEPVDLTVLEDCLAGLVSELAEKPEFWETIHSKDYPDNYLTGRQIIGLYYFFRPIVAWQVESLNETVTGIFQRYENKHDWHYYYPGYPDHPDDVSSTALAGEVRQGNKLFNKTPSELARPLDQGLPASSQTPAWADIAAIFDPHKNRDELGFPKFSQQQANLLFAHYHPVIAIEAGHPDDRIGRPYWQVDRWTTSSEPEVYTLLTHTLWQGEWVPQLVYHWWYPGRPKAGLLDILAGDLSGLIWRVTLDWDGQVLFYDSIHPCGCYHKVYPAQPSIEFLGTSPGEELLMVLPVEHPGAGYQPIIEITSIAHYVVGLGFGKTGEVHNSSTSSQRNSFPYHFHSYDELRTLRAGDRYLFGPDGLVAGSERLERFLLWNMGVDSPGAMRQWGTHATAFASRRHFDDPQLFQRYFRVKNASDN